jgi:integrase
MAAVWKRVRNGKTTWVARWRDPDGVQRKRSFARRADADRFVAGVAADIARGSYVDPAAGRLRVEAWAEIWSGAQAHLKYTTRARYQGVVRVHVLPRWGRRPLSSITHAEVGQWVSDLASTGLQPGSVRYAHAVLSSMLALAVRDGRLTRNPAEGVPLPRIQPREPRFLSLDEVSALAAASGDSATVIWFLALTGLRFGEMAALRVKRVDLARRRVVVAESVTEVSGRMVWSTPKSHRTRSVPLPGQLASALAHACAGRGGEDLVFTSPTGGVLRINNWRPRVFDPACRAAGLEGVSPHDLRHTAASLAVSSGANVKAIQRMLGHASAAMTLDVYAGLFGDDLDDVATRLDGLVPPLRPDAPDDDPDEDPPGVLARL